jgi:putative ATP-binding cassette transporter
MPDTTPATALTDAAAAPAAAPQPTPNPPATPAHALVCLEAVHERGAPVLAGRPETHGLGLLALLVGLMVLETQLAVMLIEKTGELTSALAAKQVDRFWSAVRASLMVVAVAVPVYAFYYYMRDAFSNHWRRWLTHRFLDGYLSERKYYDIGNSRDIDNPDQRISEDINTFTGRSTHFLLIFLGSLMQLVAFSAVLWSISHTLVAFLAVYALLGTFGALYLFGAPLIRLNFWQIRREADFRFGLMRLRENAESIAFYRGEPGTRPAQPAV